MLEAKKKWFEWHSNPRDISFNQALEEFTALFETIVKEQTVGKNVILPLSGGLDSRTQAVALRNHPNVFSFSYEFANGYSETKIAQSIAKISGFEFKKFKVQKGYLWGVLEELASINGCFSEFTHPRQMAFVDQFKVMGDVFSLGHLGDLYFDSMELPELSKNDQIELVKKMFIKKGGFDLADKLWTSWNLEGNFEEYFHQRIEDIVDSIEIKNTNAKMRAIKTQYSVVRWSSNNLSVFESVAPITLPYYDNRMCEFICTIPDAYLAKRQLQIEYIKKHAPDLARITWEAQKPFNLNNYHLNKSPYNLPYRISNKLKREFNGLIGKPYISRNWELQFLGKENDRHLKKWLFESGLEDLVPTAIIQQFYTNFKEKDAVRYSHSVSMLLTLALFNKKFNIK